MSQSTRAVSDQTSSSFPRKREPRASDGVLPWTPACAGVTKKWIRPVGKCASSEARLQKLRHAVPGEVGGADVVCLAALVGKGMRGVVAVDLMRNARFLQRLFEIVDGGRGAPIVLVGEVALQRNADLRRVGELLRRNAVK